MINKKTVVKIDIEKETWKPDRLSTIPLFKQIYDFIILKISSGEWSIGMKMPTQINIANSFNVNRSTIVEVYDELKAQGFVESQKSSGTIIVNNTWSILTSKSPPDWGKKISESIHSPNLDIVKIINGTDSGKGFIKLGAGEISKELMPLEFMKDIIKNLSDKIDYLGYEEQRGILPLRKEIANYLRKKGIFVESEKILIVSGALQALNLISTSLLRRGSMILTEKPSYLQSLTLFDSHGINLSGVTMDEEGISLDGILKQCALKKPDILYTIPNYQNPTNIVMSEARRKVLLELCEKERLSVIEDDVYGDLWFDKKPPNPMKSYDKNGSILYVGSVSKTLSAGMRIGWIVANENIIARLADVKMQTDYGSSNLSQWICYEFFKNGEYERYLAELRINLKDRRDWVLGILEKHFKDIAKWNIPSGGFYIWLELNNNISPYGLFERCYKNWIIINPGQLYDHLDKKSLRISFACSSKEELEIGLIKLSQIIKSL